MIILPNINHGDSIDSQEKYNSGYKILVITSMKICILMIDLKK